MLNHQLLLQQKKINTFSPASFYKSKRGWLNSLICEIEFNEKHNGQENCSGFNGSDRERAIALQELLETPKFLMATNGGYGSIRTLQHLSLTGEERGVLVGFSDLTTLINYLPKVTKVACFHGPMCNFPAKLQRGGLLEHCFYEFFYSEEHECSLSFDGELVLANQLEGQMVGGNLSVISSLWGTPYELDLYDKILFLEDVNEATYRIDRMLTQLSLQKGFSRLRGIVFGTFTDCRPQPIDCGDLKVDQLLHDFVEKWQIPAIFNAPIGHTKDFMIVPINGFASWRQRGNRIEVKMDFPEY